MFNHKSALILFYSLDDNAKWFDAVDLDQKPQHIFNLSFSSHNGQSFQ